MVYLAVGAIQAVYIIDGVYVMVDQFENLWW